MFEIESGQIFRKFQDHSQRINSCAFNEDLSVLITGSYDRTIKIWDLKSWGQKPIETLKNFKDSVTKVIVEDCEIIASSIDGTVKTFDLRMGEIRTDNL